MKQEAGCKNLVIYAPTPAVPPVPPDALVPPVPPGSGARHSGMAAFTVKSSSPGGDTIGEE
jgi:hypothetical protein